MIMFCNCKCNDVNRSWLLVSTIVPRQMRFIWTLVTIQWQGRPFYKNDSAVINCSSFYSTLLCIQVHTIVWNKYDAVLEHPAIINMPEEWHSLLPVLFENCRLTLSKWTNGCGIMTCQKYLDQKVAYKSSPTTLPICRGNVFNIIQ